MDNISMASFNYKTILIGDAGVGKTSLVKRYVTGNRPGIYDLTIGVEYEAIILPVSNESNGKTNVKLQIWDTAGQETFRSIVNSYYNGAIGAIIVFDVTNRTSYNHIPSWLREVRDRGNENVKIMLIGNKCDLEEKREVSKDEARELSNKNGIDYIEASAMTNHLVGHIFEKLAQDIYNQYPESFFASPENKDIEIPGIKCNEYNSILHISRETNMRKGCGCG